MASASTSPGGKPDRHPHPRKRLRVWWFVALVVVIGVLVLGNGTLGEHLRRGRASDDLRRRIDRLVLAVPPGLTEDEWAAAVRWTDNLHCNALLAFEVELKDIRQLEIELAARAQAGADLATIYWLWNRYAELAPSGARYNHRFRSVMDEYIERARLEGDIYGDYASFREHVRTGLSTASNTK